MSEYRILTPEEVYEIEVGISKERRQLIDLKVEETYKVFEEHYNRTFVRPAIKFDLKGETAGYAIGSDEIRLNRELLSSPEHFNEMLSQTLPHEIAHCVQTVIYPKSKPHGWEWMQLMLMLRLMPDRTHSMPATKARNVKRYTMYCKCGEHPVSSIKFNRILSGKRKYYCTKCRYYLSLTQP